MTLTQSSVCRRFKEFLEAAAEHPEPGFFSGNQILMDGGVVTIGAPRLASVLQTPPQTQELFRLHVVPVALGPASPCFRGSAAAEPREAEDNGPDVPWQVIKVGNHDEAEGAGRSARGCRAPDPPRGPGCGAAEHTTDYGLHVFVLSMLMRVQISVGTSLTSHTWKSVSSCVT